MHTLNLYLLSRTTGEDLFPDLERTLSGRQYTKRFSAHEIASLRALTDALEQAAADSGDGGPAQPGTDSPASEQASSPGAVLLPLLDGFCFSYTIGHISKEFDLLKLAPDRSLVLNIELKSAAVSEDRIRKQLEQNRYYLSHISRSILSYTYVAETDTLYSLNDRGYFARAEMSELLGQLQRPAFAGSIEGELEDCFRASDYLISPVADPDRFLRGEYFLTNQQAQFKQEILELLARERTPAPPFISLTGSAGTGKTLLLLDLGMDLSRKKEVLFLHGGILRAGHRRLDALLRHITFLDAHAAETAQLLEDDERLQPYVCILCDEANRFPLSVIEQLAVTCRRLKIPCILAHDPHRLLRSRLDLTQAEALIDAHTTLHLELSGNIRINHPVYAFLRRLFNRKLSMPQQIDLSCIEVLYASDAEEAAVIRDRFKAAGYIYLPLPEHEPEGGASPQPDAGAPQPLPGTGLPETEHPAGADLTAGEYDRVLLLLDDRFAYDEEQMLYAKRLPASSMSLLYEGLTRTREQLCLLVVGSESLFADLLAIRSGK